MSDPRKVDPLLDRAEEVYAAWLGDREGGAETSLEDLCDRHPELAEVLRTLAEDERAVDPGLLGLGDPLPAPADEPGAGDEIASFLDRLENRRRPAERYRSQGELGRGGMGVVERAWDPDLERPLARKFVATCGGTHGQRRLRRFLTEARVTAGLEHPGIVPVHELGLDAEGRVYFTMPVVEGCHFGEVIALERDGSEEWTLKRAVGVLQRVCEAVAYAHDRGVVHRDLKPANIMVGRFGEVYVLDWGLARRGDPGLPKPTATPLDAEALQTQDGDVVGTPAYMAPEQARGDLARVGFAADIYSAGAILYHLLAGQAPYVDPGVDSSSTAVLARVLEGPPRPIERVAGDRPAELCAIAARAMAREPADRYGTMLDLAYDLRAYLEHRVVEAHRTGALAELRKWISRNRALAASLIVSILLVTGGSAAAAVVLAEKNQETTAALASAEREAQTAAAVVEFLHDMVREAGPVRQGLSTTVVDALDARAASIDESFPEDPHVAARVHGTVGDFYRSIGRIQEGEHHLGRSLELHRQSGTDRTPAGLAVLRRLSEVLLAQKRQDDDALALLAGSVELHSTTLGAEAPETLEAMNNLAVIHAWRKERDEAQRIMRELVERSSSAADLVGLEQRATWMSNLASLSEDEEAESLLRECIAIRRELYPDGSDRLYKAMHKLGQVLRRRGQPEEALALHEEAVRGRRRFREQGDGELLETELAFALACMELERFERAGEVLDGILATAPAEWSAQQRLGELRAICTQER